MFYIQFSTIRIRKITRFSSSQIISHVKNNINPLEHTNITFFWQPHLTRRHEIARNASTKNIILRTLRAWKQKTASSRGKPEQLRQFHPSHIHQIKPYIRVVSPCVRSFVWYFPHKSRCHSSWSFFPSYVP